MHFQREVPATTYKETWQHAICDPLGRRLSVWRDPLPPYRRTDIADVCHCTDCKHQSGSAFGMSLRMRKADVELLQGSPKQWTTRSDNGNPKICVFCGTCGTRLWHGPGPLGNLSVKPGTLDDPSQLAPRYEGWTKRKLPWLRIEGLEASFEEQGSSHRPASAS